jgi:NAD(P)-dependent dehydrogenase (short-subunit alcohol dehydrogenase family)
MTGTASYDFAGETAIVTGSTKGIGRGIATGLVDAGANVVLTARTESDVEAAADELNERATAEVLGVPADVGVPEELEHLVDRAVEEFDTIDLLVNNAAVFPDESSLLTVPWRIGNTHSTSTSAPSSTPPSSSPSG